VELIAAVHTQGVVTSPLLGDALKPLETLAQGVSASVQPISEAIKKFQKFVFAAITDSHSLYQLALARLREKAADALNDITTRQGRDYLQGKATQDEALAAVLAVASLSVIRPRCHQRITERVTCLQAPRANLAYTAA
jgi:hypothetical protein